MLSTAGLERVEVGCWGCNLLSGQVHLTSGVIFTFYVDVDVKCVNLFAPARAFIMMIWFLLRALLYLGHYVSSLLHQHSVNSQPCLVSVKTCLIRIWSYIEPAVQEKAGGCWWYMCVWFRCDALQIKVIVKCFCIMCMQLEWVWDRLKWFQCCIWLLWNRLWSYRYCRCEAFVRFHTHTVLPSSSLGKKNEIK